MNYPNNITISQYLNEKGIEYTERGTELVAKCIFSTCDDDSRPNEAHLYFHATEGMYHCKKCQAKGNLITLVRHFGDYIGEKNNSSKSKTSKKPKKKISEAEVLRFHKNLPNHIRKYLNDRGITDEIITQAKIGYGDIFGENRITIPIYDRDGKLLYAKARVEPGKQFKKGTKFKFYPGGKAHLYDYKTLKSHPPYLTICEGELDSLLLNKEGIPTISSTTGVQTFNPEWFEYLKGIPKFYLAFDNDNAGKTAASILAQQLYGELEDIEVYSIEWPEAMQDAEDVTDYFIKYGGTKTELLEVLPQKVKNRYNKRIVEIPEPEQLITFTEWKNIIQQKFPTLLFPAEVCAAIMAQILILDITNPFGLVLVDVPSSGKTIVLNFFSEIKNISYVSDKFTPASFVSNAANVKRDALKEVDLLPRIRYKTFIVRDLAPLFSKREDDLNECLGILTRVFDGEGLATESGVHGQRHYNGEYLFMMLAASTPMSPKIWKMMGNLGSRLFFLYMNSQTKGEDELVAQLQSTAFKKKEKYCRKMTQQFLYTLWKKHKHGIKWDKTKDDVESLRVIARCARLLARLRGVINIWKERTDGEEQDAKYNYTQPTIEQPDRLNQLFYNIARGHAVLNDRDYINQDDLKLVVELAFDSAPSIRAMLFRKLIDNGGKLTTTEVEQHLNCSKPTALKEMETLQILGLVHYTTDTNGTVGNSEKVIALNHDYQWFLSHECGSIRNPNMQMVYDLF